MFSLGAKLHPVAFRYDNLAEMIKWGLENIAENSLRLTPIWTQYTEQTWKVAM